MRENDGVPTLAERNTSVVLISDVNVSPPAISKKLEFAGLRPFTVKPRATLELVAPVFLMVMNLVTYPNLIPFVSPEDSVDEERNGMAETWYAGA